MKLIISKPDGTTRVRVFKDRAEAAEFGVRYYLIDDCHAPIRMADVAAANFAGFGVTTLGGYTFTEQAE